MIEDKMKTIKRVTTFAPIISPAQRGFRGSVVRGTLSRILLLISAFACLNLAPARVQAQDGMASIKLKNDGDMELTAKLVGGTPRAVKLIGSSMFTLRVPPGNYHFLYQFYDADHKSYIYQSTRSFAVNANITTTVECCRGSHYVGGRPHLHYGK
jgi:hypothetical protein